MCARQHSQARQVVISPGEKSHDRPCQPQNRRRQPCSTACTHAANRTAFIYVAVLLACWAGSQAATNAWRVLLNRPTHRLSSRGPARTFHQMRVIDDRTLVTRRAHLVFQHFLVNAKVRVRVKIVIGGCEILCLGVRSGRALNRRSSGSGGSHGGEERGVWCEPPRRVPARPIGLSRARRARQARQAPRATRRLPVANRREIR